MALANEPGDFRSLAGEQAERVPEGRMPATGYLFQHRRVQGSQHSIVDMSVQTHHAWMSSLSSPSSSRIFSRQSRSTRHERPGDPLNLSQFPCANESSKQRHPQADDLKAYSRPFFSCQRGLDSQEDAALLTDAEDGVQDVASCVVVSTASRKAHRCAPIAHAWHERTLSRQ